ncbi:MAG TPA: TMEM175 family protein [Tepidisphaeraceae bacterium]|jgi:uncharacterized membrane protein|nr:TMEM175 family protein [Tepidisphaeraceae bacterium]
MHKGRLEAFSDGVLAIIITIMVLELHAPHDPTLATLASLKPLIPTLLSYVLSFIYVGIYWNNHHHMLQASRHVTGSVLWANLHLLFWLSLVPFVTTWIGASHFAPLPCAAYGLILLMAAVAYTILARTLIHSHGQDSPLAKALGSDTKGHLSLLLYTIAIPSAFLSPWIACSLYLIVAILWLIPDRRIERQLKHDPD